MKSFIKAVDRFSLLVDKVVTAVAVFVLVSMTVVTTAQIICRFFFTALSWSEELCRYLMIWLTFLGASMAVRRKAHIAVTFAVSQLPAKLKKIAACLVYALSLYFFLLLVIYGYRLMNFEAFQVAAGLGVSMRYPYMAIPVGGVLCAIHTVAHLLKLFEGDTPWE